eukprot:CAMPEP_0181025642 /NCGR_PEP_ID=MMETSP1070-20121207/3209_1 /TAXON_ID=265543 /ORGANISM="Minutocellus polymorphus, Strain NH13" /LENGTH=797 /DNA_ID=CAMNT_0023102769 /DNA_START=542 /DNA_END=2935 /DNA_ORIENTATION=-
MSRSHLGSGSSPMLCEGGGNDDATTCSAVAADHGQSAGGPTTATRPISAAAALRRRTGELPGRPARLPSLGSLHSLSNPSFSSSGSIHIQDIVPLALQTAAAASGTNQPFQELKEREGADFGGGGGAPLVAGLGNTAPRSTAAAPAAAPLKLQKASTSTEQRRSDMNFLRSRRRQWLEDQARQIEREEHGRHCLGEGEEGHGSGAGAGSVQHLTEVAETAAQTASEYFGSPLSNNKGMSSAGHFRHRSVSITGINLPSPMSQRFILNLPAEGDGGQFGGIIICNENATASAGTQRLALAQTKEEEEGEEEGPDEADVDYAIGAETDVCMDANPKDEHEDDESTVVMDCSEIDNNERFSDQGIGNASASEEQRPRHGPPVFKRYPAINLRRRSDDGLPTDELYPISQDTIGIPSARSSDSLFDSIYRRSSDGAPGTGTDNLGEDFVVPSRPRSSDPRFATHFQGHGLRPKLVSEASSTFKPAAPEAPTRSTSRRSSGPAPPPPPIYDQGDFVTSIKPKPPHDNSSSKQLVTLKQPRLLDTDLTSTCIDSETQMEAMVGLVTFDREDDGVEVSLPPHLSADGFDSMKEEDSCKVRAVTTEAFPSRRPRPANVSTFDRSNSIAEEARGGSFGGSTDVASANGMSGRTDAFFTPPHVRTKVKFGAGVQGMKGEENAPPSARNSRFGGRGFGLSTSPPLGLPVGWLARPIPLQKHPNTSSFDRSASVGGVYASPDQSSAGGGHLYRTPGEIAPQRNDSTEGNGGMHSYSTAARGQQCSNQRLAAFRPRLPSLASPMEEDNYM